MVHKEEELHPERNSLVRLFQRFIPVTPKLHGTALLHAGDAGWIATPMFIALLVVESSDLLFAIDSLPAVIAVTATRSSRSARMRSRSWACAASTS